MKSLTITLAVSLLVAFSNFALAQSKAPIVSVTAPDAAAGENGDTGRFLVHRSHGLKNPLRVHFRVVGNAIEGADYETLGTSVVIPARQSVARVWVRPVDDGLAEGREKVGIRIVPSPGRRVQPYAIGPKSSAVVKIEDDDPVELATTNLAPTASGTIIRYVELNDYFVDDDPVLGTYYYKTMHGREFFRAFLEFEIPPLNSEILSATLKLSETTPVENGQTLHDLWHYPADLELGTNDFFAPATLIGGFQTDTNVMGESIDFDMTAVVRQYIGNNLGVRIKLAVDPDYNEPGWLGSRFAGVHEPNPPRLLIRTTQRPHVVITSPSETSSIVGPTNIVIKAVAVDQDGFVSRVDFWANGQKIGEQLSTAEPARAATAQRFSMVWSNVPPGIHVLEATTIDNQGAQSISTPVTITVGPCEEEIVLVSRVSGSIDFFPEVDRFTVNVNPNTTDLIKSVYSARTGSGVTREFVRGFLEFEVPTVPAGIVSATLTMQAGGAIGTLPNFTDTHEVWAYLADLVIDLNDYDRGTVLAGTFQTEIIGPAESIAMDITDLVRNLQGANLGLRIKLAIDPDTHDPNTHGDVFHNVRIVIVTCK